DQQHTEAEDLEQHAMEALRRYQLILEEIADPLDGGRGEGAGRENRHSPLLAGIDEDLGRPQSFGRHEDRHVLPGHALHALHPHLGIEGGQEAKLALADDLHPSWLDVLVEAGERQAGLLHPGMEDQSLEAVLATENVEVEIREG